jgi:hypothetical protein
MGAAGGIYDLAAGGKRLLLTLVDRIVTGYPRDEGAAKRSWV